MSLGIFRHELISKSLGRETQMPFDLSQYANADPHLSSGERALSVLVGLGLTSIAAQPRPNVFLSMLALATGSYLAYRGATGYCVIKASLNDQPVLESHR